MMITLDGVTKIYRLKGGQQKHIARHVSAALPWSNIAVLGRNGAGKSTFLRMLAGITRPDEGLIVRHGLVSWPMGFRGSFHREMSGLENVKFVSRVYGQDTEYVIDYVKSFAELGPFFDEPYRTYSSGMGARLAFGLSLAIDFDIYLIDELMSVGDARFRKKSRAAFAERLDDSRLIMVSHSMDTLKEYCDAALILEDGHISLYREVDAAIEAYEALNAE